MPEHQDDTPLLNLSASRASPRPSSLTRYLLLDRKSPRCYLTAVWVLFQEKVSQLYGILTLNRDCQNVFWSPLFTNINLQCSSSCAIPIKVYPLPREAVSQLVQSPLTPAFP